MDIMEAMSECQQWLDYLKRQEEKTKALQKIANERRKGMMDELECRIRLRSLENGVTVYDGANLAKAVRVLLNNVNISK